MLKQVILQSSTPMTLDIENADPTEALILKSISGLTPADVNLFTGEYSSEGGYYQGRRSEMRFPVFNFKLNPDYVSNVSVSDIREGLYRTFYEPQALTDGLQVTLKDDKKPDRYFVCYPEKWTGDIFEKDPDAQISTKCTDGFLRSVLETSGANAGGWVSTTFNYDGSADTGIEVTLKVTTATNQIVFSINGNLMTLNKATNFAVNDVITINTNIFSRAIKLNGVDAMALLSASSKWQQIVQVANTISTYATVAADGKVVITSWKFRSAWRGV